MYLHSKQLMHRDIKADNILVDQEGSIKISRFTHVTSLKAGEKIISFVGSPCWMSPEKIEQKDGYDFKSDVWALGITAIELAEGNVPFQDHPPMKALMNIFNSDPPNLNKYEHWSQEFRSMVYDCLIKDASRRVSAPELLAKHRSFFKKAKAG